MSDRSSVFSSSFRGSPSFRAPRVFMAMAAMVAMLAVAGIEPPSASAVPGDSFQDGDVYMCTSLWPDLFGVVARIEPDTGNATVLYDFTEQFHEGHITYDPYRDRLVIMPDINSNTYTFVDANGNTTQLPNPWGQLDIASWAPTGDGRIYQIARVGTLGLIDANDQSVVIMNEDGVTPFHYPYGSTLREHLIYDTTTNSLFFTFLGEATQVLKIPLTDDGTQLREAPILVEYDAFPNEFDEPTAISAGPNGTIFIKIRAASTSAGLQMFTVDPVTLQFAPYAYIHHTGSAWNMTGVYVPEYDIAVALDSWNNVIRSYVESPAIQSGAVLATGVSGASHGERAVMVCIGGSINGPPITPADCGDANGDSTVDVTDLLAILAAWGPCPGCPEDLNADGVVDVNDLLFVLSSWGPC